MSYSAVHQNLSKKIGGYADKYQQFVVEYVAEWDRVVSTRINSGLKTTETLRRDLDHYQRKVEELHVQVNKALTKGKMVDDKTKEKLKRNEEKHVKAKESYNIAARDMCMLLEETVDYGWKDLHPILVKMAQFDMTLAGEESKCLAEMDAVVTALKALASSSNIKGAGRLKELSEQQVSLLYTGSNSRKMPAIEDTTTQWGQANISDENRISLPPGSVAPQSMGGFPVQVQEEEPSPGQTIMPIAPATLVSNRSSAVLSTSDMLDVARNAAPPPTLQQIDSVDDREYSQAAFSTNPFDCDTDGPVAPAPFSPPPPPPVDSPASLNFPSTSYQAGGSDPPGVPNQRKSRSSRSSRSSNPFDPPVGGTGRDPPTNPFAF